MTSSGARASCACFAILLIGLTLSAQTRINTPFEVVSLWSKEMEDLLANEEHQPACSGAKLADCKRLNEGVCDGIVDVAFGDSSSPAKFPSESPTMQTGRANPKGFYLVVANAEASTAFRPFRLFGRDEPLELKFECANAGSSDGDDCPTGIFHIGLLRAVELRTPYGERLFDLMQRSRVDPEGTLIVSLDDAMRKVVYGGAHPFYRVRVATQCFAVPRVTKDWTLPVYDGPSARSKSLGAIIARVTSGSDIAWIYRSNTGQEISFDPDWSQGDWGYLYLMEQTVLDRRGDWVQLPRQPFPQPVWLQLSASTPRESLYELPGRYRLEADGSIYRVSKTVTARTKDGKGTVRFNDEDTLVIVAVHDRLLEVRKDDEFDSPCAVDKAPAGRTYETFLVNADEFYDADLHLRIVPAYPKGC
jgi:hypothetical protein